LKNPACNNAGRNYRQRKKEAALAAGLSLITNNTREFAGIDGFKLENWA